MASPIAPENTAFEPNLYALSGVPNELRASIESHYMAPEVDTPASNALARLLASDLPNMSDGEKRAWARFLMSLALRNPETVASVNVVMRRQMIAQLSVEAEVREAHQASGNSQRIEAWIEDLTPARSRASFSVIQTSFLSAVITPPFVECVGWSSV